MPWAFGKAIVLGEHAVVYGHPALAGAIDCPLHCQLALRPAGAPAGVRVRVPAWDIDVDSSHDAHHPVAEVVRALMRHLLPVAGAQGAAALAADITVTTRLPAAAGLGSSAALAVALARTLSRVLGLELPADDIARAADVAEQIFHANPSGVDVALATRGGMGLYRRGQGMTPIAAPPLAIAVGLSGQPRRTADMVARVAAERERAPAATGACLVELGQAALAGAEAVARGQVATLGALMQRAHELLAAVGVSTPTLDALVSTAMAAGALGAKLTGAGGGGAVIAVAGGREAEIVAAWQRRGFAGFVCHVGATSAAPGPV